MILTFFLSILPKNITLDKNKYLFIIQLVSNAQDILNDFLPSPGFKSLNGEQILSTLR